MDPFLEYRQAYDELQNDPEARELRERIRGLQELLVKGEEKYQKRMAKAEAEIVAAVLEQGKSATLHNVEAQYHKGRESTSWKGVAGEMNAPEDVIARFTKIGEATVLVRAL